MVTLSTLRKTRVFLLPNTVRIRARGRTYRMCESAWITSEVCQRDVGDSWICMCHVRNGPWSPFLVLEPFYLYGNLRGECCDRDQVERRWSSMTRSLGSRPDSQFKAVSCEQSSFPPLANREPDCYIYIIHIDVLSTLAGSVRSTSTAHSTL